MRSVHPFPARMAPDTVARWLGQLPEGARVLDPMCGSGMVLRQSAQLGYEALGYDIDPLAVLMSKVWTRRGRHSQLAEIARDVARSANRKRVGYLALPWISKCAETRAFVEYWFSEPQRSALTRLVLAIHDRDSIYPRWVIDALYLSLSRIIVTKQAGASLAWDVSHSRPHKKRDNNDYDTISGFVKSADALAELLDETALIRSAHVRRGDCRRLTSLRSRSIDAVVTSPPYLNAIDYLRGHKLSLIWMGFTIPTLRNVRATSVGTEKGGALSLDPNAKDPLSECAPTIVNLPGRQRAIVHKYAYDANLIFAEIDRLLTDRGRVVLVLADSVVRGVDVPSSSIFEWAARKNGFGITEKHQRDIPNNRRYLPINSKNEALGRRMRTETIQVFERSN